MAQQQAAPFHAFTAFKVLTLDIAASIFVGVELGPETTKMNHVFEDLVAASMSRVRLRIPGLEFYRGLDGREFMVEYFARRIPSDAPARAATCSAGSAAPSARTAPASPTPTSSIT